MESVERSEWECSGERVLYEPSDGSSEPLEALAEHLEGINMLTGEEEDDAKSYTSISNLRREILTLREQIEVLSTGDTPSRPQDVPIQMFVQQPLISPRLVALKGRQPSVGKQKAPGRPTKPALSSQEHRLTCLEDRVGGMTHVLEERLSKIEGLLHPGQTTIPTVVGISKEKMLTLVYGDSMNMDDWLKFEDQYKLVRTINLAKKPGYWSNPEYRACILRLNLTGYIGEYIREEEMKGETWPLDDDQIIRRISPFSINEMVTNRLKNNKRGRKELKKQRKKERGGWGCCFGRRKRKQPQQNKQPLEECYSDKSRILEEEGQKEKQGQFLKK